MNPGATENLSHLWVLDKFRVVQRLALIFLRGRGGPSGLRRPIIAQFSAKKCALRAPGEVGVGNAPQRRLRSVEALELEDLLAHVGADKARKRQGSAAPPLVCARGSRR
jgi:hypothetical protein